MVAHGAFRRGLCVVAASMVLHAWPARADAPADRCAPASNAESQRQVRRYNDGLPALGTVMMSVAAAAGLVTVFGASMGVLGTVELAETLPERALGAAGVFVVVSGGMLTATTLGLAGFAIWFIAWLPPVRSTLRRCPPAENGR